jgi:hypothetical protein
MRDLVGRKRLRHAAARAAERAQPRRLCPKRTLITAPHSTLPRTRSAWVPPLPRRAERLPGVDNVVGLWFRRRWRSGHLVSDPVGTIC